MIRNMRTLMAVNFSSSSGVRLGLNTSVFIISSITSNKWPFQCLEVVFKICFPSLVGQHWNSAFSKFSMNLLPLGVDELWIFPLEQEIVVSALPGNYVGTTLSAAFFRSFLLLMGRPFTYIASRKCMHAQYLIDSLSVQGLLKILIFYTETY